MGLGDEIMGTGLAKGAAARGKRIAFGNGKRIIWHWCAADIFQGNPNIAQPGSERAPSLEWIEHYPGQRVYCRMARTGRRRWEFTPGTQRAGEFYFTAQEKAAAAEFGNGLVILEPNTKHQAPNKQWGVDRYRTLAGLLAKKGYRVAQFATGGMALAGVEQIRTPSFRRAAAVLQRARLYIGPEGGLHHAAAAVGIPAVVIFGGFISPAVTGYASHTNIFTGDGLGCGNVDECAHCRRAMAKISVGEVLEAAWRICDEGHSGGGTSGDCADEAINRAG